MNEAMTICYVVEGSLYVNVTNRCTNSCDFCIRNNGDTAYGSDTLWLKREPDADEIFDAIVAYEPTKYRELVFCGYGEPTMRLYDIIEVAKKVKKAYPVLKIRLNTNGHSDLIFGIDTAPLYKGAFDSVSISLNTPSAEKYVEICHPVYKEKTFAAILSFAKNVKNYVQYVQFSLVDAFLTEEEIEECRHISESVGVNLRIREYIKD